MCFAWRLYNYYALRVQVFAASWVEDEVQKSFTLTPFRSPAIANVRGACPLCWWSHKQTIALFQPAVWGFAERFFVYPALRFRIS